MTLDEFLVKLKATGAANWVIRPSGSIRCGVGCPITMVATNDTAISAAYAAGYAARLGLSQALKAQIIAAADNARVTYSIEKIAEIRSRMLNVLGLENRP